MTALADAFGRAVAHIARHGDTDVFPFPPENHLFHDRREAVVEVLEQTHSDFGERLDIDATTGVSAMAPVGYTGFRWATQLDPLWNAYLLGLVVHLGPNIEAARLDRSVVHSHRFEVDADDDEIFARDGYLSFEAASKAEAEDAQWVVVTDIGDFYSRIYHHRLENALKEVAEISDAPWRIMRLLG